MGFLLLEFFWVKVGKTVQKPNGTFCSLGNLCLNRLKRIELSGVKYEGQAICKVVHGVELFGTIATWDRGFIFFFPRSKVEITAIGSSHGVGGFGCSR